MPFAATVNVTDKVGGFGSLLSAIKTSALYAASVWGNFISGKGTLDIQIDIFDVPNLTTGDGSSVTSVPLFTQGGISYEDEGTIYELRTGLDPNQSAPDIIIRIDPSYINDWLFFGADPATTPVPPNKADSVRFLMHEIGHALGFNTWRDLKTGAVTGSERPYDIFIEMVGGIPHFTGPQAQIVYGGPVPLTVGNFTHLGNAPGPGIAIDSLMYGPSAATGKFVGPSPLELAILRDVFSIGASKSVVAIDEGSSAKSEGNGGSTDFTFQLSRVGNSSLAQSVSYTVVGTGNSPANALDFGGVLPTGTVTFASGETTKTLTINVTGDSLIESDEGFKVILSGPSQDLAIGNASALGNIVNDDAPASASVSINTLSSSKTEGNGGTTEFTFLLVRSGDIAKSHTVSFATTGSGANPASASDFVGGILPTGSLTFAPGEIGRSIVISVQGDTLVESQEGFTVTLSAPSTGLAIGTATAAGTILNDDGSTPSALVAYNDGYISPVQAPAANIFGFESVLLNDVGAAGASVTLLSQPAHGQVKLAADGTFTLALAGPASGIDFFDYRVTNSSGVQDDARASIYYPPIVHGAVDTLALGALSPEEQIASNYVAFFGRGADKAGFDFWVDQFAKGLPSKGPSVLFSDIANSFGASVEAKALYPFLANPYGSSDAQIGDFLNTVYDNMFNRTPDAHGLAYWTNSIKATLLAGQFVGYVLVQIIGGAQNSAAGQDINNLMSKIAVNLEYVKAQRAMNNEWTWADDQAEAMALLAPVSDVSQTVLTGIKNAYDLVSADV